MKEMTIEQKAKAYDEALKVAHRLYEQGTITESLSYIFPELKESEEGKVRKALIEMVHDTTGDSLWVDYNIHKEEALAWLEKQESVEGIVSRCKTSWYNEGKIQGQIEGLSGEEKYLF